MGIDGWGVFDFDRGTDFMKTLRSLLSLFAALALPAGAADAWLHFPAKEGTANGKKVVLISGDEEYRTEESCPMLAKILSQTHGFDCTVLFAIHPEGGYIDPNYQKNIPGLEALREADLMIISTRFRQLPDAQFAELAAYLDSGKPVIGYRTATHAFTGASRSGNFAWADFGTLILGETWVSHHGKHKVQGARGVLVEANAAHPILNGVTDVFAKSDVYGVKRVTDENATILLRGAVTETLEPDSAAVTDGRNDPMMASAWLKEWESPNGEAKGAAFCTTMGGAVDFLNEGLRRLIVNAAFHLTGLPVPEKADVAFIDTYEPSFFGFIKDDSYFATLKLMPSDHALGQFRATGVPEVTTK